MKSIQSELSTDKMKSVDHTPYVLDYINQITDGGIPHGYVAAIAGEMRKLAAESNVTIGPYTNQAIEK